MPRFDYVALTAQGNEVRGTLDAADLDAARLTLRGKALMPMSVELETTGNRFVAWLGGVLRHPARLLPVRSSDKQFMFRQLALMVKSGHRLRSALDSLDGLVGRKGLSDALRRMVTRIDGGASFAEALSAEGKLFPRHVPALVDAGERSGTLDHVLEEIAGSMERSRALTNAVARALVMPSITLIVAFGVLGFVVLWLVPILTAFLIKTGGEIHWTMMILVSITEFMQVWGRFIAGAAVIAVFGTLVAYTTEKGRLWLDWLLLWTPIFGRSIVLFEMSRLGGIGMLLIRSGLRQVEVCRVLANVTQNRFYREQYHVAADKLLEGASLGDSLNPSIFDRLALHLIAVGESSGNIEEVLDRIGIYYADEVETRIRVLFGTLVPAITILVGIVVGVIYISVILTILGAVNSIR